MTVAIHPADTMLRGDGCGYNPRSICPLKLAGRRELITGVFRDDGVGSTNRPDRPFRITLPAGFQAWQSLNIQVFYALKSNAREIIIDLA